MKNIKVSDLNKARLDKLLACKIGKEENPAVIMDDVVGELLDSWDLNPRTPVGTMKVKFSGARLHGSQ